MPRIRTRVRPGAKVPSAIDSDPGRYENRLLLILVAVRVPDKLGRRKPILIAAVVLFSCFSAAGRLMTGFLGLLIARALMGVAEGAGLPMAQSLMVEACRENRRGLHMRLLQGSSVGQAVEGERSPMRGTESGRHLSITEQ
ncbi:MFS transporter [Streptomyces sp. NBC_00076]|uniref:MFS transporter n=1 Tax=Streptomyces sp. NBC_00076 TaxID=2975642 RepID=UPI003253FA8E